MTDSLSKYFCKNVLNENKLLKERITKLEYSILVYAEQKKQLREENMRLKETIKKMEQFGVNNLPQEQERDPVINYDKLFEEFLESDTAKELYQKSKTEADFSRWKSQMKKRRNTKVNQKRLNQWIELKKKDNDVMKKLQREIKKLKLMI